MQGGAGGQKSAPNSELVLPFTLVFVAFTLVLFAVVLPPPAGPARPPDPGVVELDTPPVPVPPARPPPTAMAVAPTAPVAASAVAPVAAVHPPRNVLLLTIDTLRHDLGYMGYPRPITPSLDTLAAHATVFERAYSLASYTPKSMGPMMIGRYGTETTRNSEHYTTFFPQNTFVAERAKAAGVRTFGGVCHRYFLFRKGFQDGFDIYDTSATPSDPKDEDPRVTSDKLTDVAIKILSRPENVGSRFFGWFHYVDPHTPYVAHPGAPNFGAMPSGGPSSYQRDVYDQEVWFTDAQVGRLIDFVRSQPWGKETAIIVTADHGEAFGDHGHYRHGREVWESLVRVPLIIDVPGMAARRVSVKRSHIDLVPTIVDLLGLPPPTGLHGKTLVTDMTSETPEERDVFVDMMKGPYNEGRRVVVTGTSPGLKLIDFEGAKQTVFDLGEDPGEEKPLKRTDPRFLQAQERFQAMVGSLEEVPSLP